MRMMIIAGAALALSACGGGSQSTDANASANMAMDQNLAADPMMNGTGNMAMDPMMNGGNMTADTGLTPSDNRAIDATENLIEKDRNTNAPDTNLANGL